MAYTASQPVKEVPGFARVGRAVRRGVLAALNPLFGTPENPTKLGRAVALAEEASQYGLSAGPAVAVGRVRYNPHPVRGTRIVDRRFLGDMTIPLQNRQAASSVVAAPKSMFSNSPGNMVLITEHNGQVILPREADVKLYGSEQVTLPGGRRIRLAELPSIVSDLDASGMSREAKQMEVAQLNAAVTPQWMYRMYQKDMADLRATLKAYRAGNRFYDNEGIKVYDVLSRGDAASIISEPVGTRFQMKTRDLGNVTFSPNHVSDMTHDRFVKTPGLYEAYNDGFLPYQSLTLLGSPYTVRGKTVTPVLRVTDHHEILRDAAGNLLRPGTAGLSVPEYRKYQRTYNVGRDIPYFGIKPVEPGGVDLMYHLDSGQNVVRANGAYSASVAVQQASKGGDSPHRNFRNFLATDKVPESIFGYPVVQREEDYTPEDVEFFRANPKAAGFYDLGDEADAAGFYDLEDGNGADAAEKGGETQPVLAFYGKRPDGTWKGTGWLGELKLPGGGVAGEYSVGVGIDGKETLIPTLTPNLSKDEIRLMVNDIIPGGKKVPDAILSKAVAHARARLAEGRSPFKNDGMDPRRGFAMSFEQPLDLRGGFVYPKKDADGQITAGGYRYFYGRSDGVRKAHSNLNRMTYAQWLRNADMADAEYASFAEGLAKSWGDSPDGAAAGFLFDVAFNSKNYQRLLSKEGSPRLYATMEQLRPVYKGKAGALALLSESDTYGTNRNRSMARGRLILSELQRSGDPGLRKVAEAYDTAYKAAPKVGKTADAQEQGRHEEGLKAVRKLLGIERK